MGKTLVFITLMAIMAGCHSSTKVQVPYTLASDTANTSVERSFGGSLQWDVEKNKEKRTRYDSKDQIQKENSETVLVDSFFIGDRKYLFTITSSHLPISSATMSVLGIYSIADGHYYSIASATTSLPQNEISMKMDYSLNRIMFMTKATGVFGYLPFELFNY